jgi:hypothetical protein
MFNGAVDYLEFVSFYCFVVNDVDEVIDRKVIISVGNSGGWGGYYAKVLLELSE